MSPDGKSILFQSSVYPGATDDEANKKIASERKARKYNARVYESFPIRYWDHWLDDKQTHLFVQTLEGQPRDLFAGTTLVTSKGYQGAQTSTGDDLAAVWSPDGSEIVFAATMNKNVAAYAETQVHLFRIKAGGGEPKQITLRHRKVNELLEDHKKYTRMSKAKNPYGDGTASQKIIAHLRKGIKA